MPKRGHLWLNWIYSINDSTHMEETEMVPIRKPGDHQIKLYSVAPFLVGHPPLPRGEGGLPFKLLISAPLYASLGVV